MTVRTLSACLLRLRSFNMERHVEIWNYLPLPTLIYSSVRWISHDFCLRIISDYDIPPATAAGDLWLRDDVGMKCYVGDSQECISESILLATVFHPPLKRVRSGWLGTWFDNRASGQLCVPSSSDWDHENPATTFHLQRRGRRLSYETGFRGTGGENKVHSPWRHAWGEDASLWFCTTLGSKPLRSARTLASPTCLMGLKIWLRLRKCST